MLRKSDTGERFLEDAKTNEKLTQMKNWKLLRFFPPAPVSHSGRGKFRK